MRISDDERREVAENLRNLTIGHSIQYKEQFFDELAEVVVGFEDYHDFDVVLDKLADLIEPAPERTCLMLDNGVELCCSECDRRHDYDDEPQFCMGCGAKVVEDD